MPLFNVIVFSVVNILLDRLTTLFFFDTLLFGYIYDVMTIALFFIFLLIIIIIMDIFKCYFSREHIALSLKKTGVNIKLLKPTESTMQDAE